MAMRSFLLFLTVCSGLSYAYRAYDVAHDLNKTEVSFRRMMERMAKLNTIQQNIIHKKVPTYKVPTASESIAWDQNIKAKPDQNPFLFEGDIVLSEEQMDKIIQDAEDQLWALGDENPKRKKRSMISHTTYRWTLPIPYYINSGSGVSESAVLAGINYWTSQTCVTFDRLSNPYFRGGHIEFLLKTGCFSNIGYSRRGKQEISIGYGCTSLGIVAHEIGHSLGFFHEQSRYDRDEYVKVMERNIQPTYMSNFVKQLRSTIEDYGVAYDYGSVMHYDPASFTANNQNTISAKDPNYQMTMGQRAAPSFGDVKKVNLAYCNDICKVKLECKNGGYTDPKACSQCRCPDGFGGVLCDRAANAPSACGPNELTATNTMQTIKDQGAINCPYIITAPPGKKVYFEVGDFAFTGAYSLCSVDYLEIKYKDDVVPSGARFCRNYPSNSLSETNRLVVIYRGSSRSRFSLRFRQDPVDSTPAPAKPTTPRTTPRTTTATPKPVPVATSSTKPWTPRPITTTNVPVPIQCSVWTACTAKCGGCGTQSRRCGKDIETIPCSLQPCKNNYCCLPYLYVGKGLCRSVYGDKARTNAYWSPKRQ